jgi:hypothetical protein
MYAVYHLPFTTCRYPPGPSRCSTFMAATSDTRRPQPAMSQRRAASRGVGAAASSLCHSSRVRKSSGCMRWYTMSYYIKLMTLEELMKADLI